LILTAILTLCLIGSSASLALSLRKNIEYMEKLENAGEAIQISLDILEEQYQIIDKKSKVELFSDEPIVKELVLDIAVAKASVMNVAKILDNVLRDNEDDIEE